MVLSKRCFNARQINELAFDCIVVGSDEVWNYRDTKGNAELKFGVGLTCKNLIAYAPSVGAVTEDTKVPAEVASGLKNIDRISGRDTETVKFIERISGRKTEKMLDPTFLYNFDRKTQDYKTAIGYRKCFQK